MKILDSIAAQAGLARFASFIYTTKTTGETARYTLQLGFSYRNVLQRSLLQLEIESQIMTGIDKEAADELIKSFKASLEGTQSKYTKKDIYKTYTDQNGKSIQGLKVNQNDGTLKVYGLVHSKIQIDPPTKDRKPVDSAPLTIAKNKLRRNLPISKFCEFDLGSLSVAKIDGETLILN